MIGSLAVLQAAAAAIPQPVAVGDCNRQQDQEIIICGSRKGENPYRLPKLPDKYDRKPFRAETDALAGVHTAVHVQSETMPDGNVARRLMLTFGIAF